MKNAELIGMYRTLDLLKLPDTVRKNGFIYRLVKRNERKLLYAQYNKLGSIVAYEVFKNHIRPYRSRKEHLSILNQDKKDHSSEPEWYETFPGNEEFGKRAWTYPTLKDAEKAFDEK